jgi:hypothetical protein
MKNMASWRLGAAAVVLAACTVGGAVAPANAAEKPAEDCGMFIETGQVVCVPHGEDLHAAVLKETGKTIIVADGAVETAAATAEIAASDVSPAASFLKARLYDDQNFGGSYFEVFGSSACASGVPVGGVSDIGSGWYGRVTSIRGYANCDVKVYENTGYGGASYGYVSQSGYVGDAMNDRTKSVTTVW